MAFPYMASYSNALHSTRNPSLSVTDPHEPVTPASKTAPASTNQPGSLYRRNNLPIRNERPRPFVATSGNVRTVNAEIERLSAMCDEHERKIRTSRSSIEHRLFTDLPHALTKLNEMDDNAESMTAQIHATINSISPILSDRLSALLSARKRDVETMRERTTPWKRYFREHAEKDETAPNGGIKRIQGAGTSDADELLRIERWAEEVEMYLTNDIAGLKRQLQVKYKRSARIKLVFITVLSIIVALWMGWFSLR